MKVTTEHRSSPRVLLIYPSSLYSTTYADARVAAIKPGLQELRSYLKSRSVAITFLDLEIECGRPANDQERKVFLAKAKELLANIPFDLVGISCLFSYNYLSSLAVADICRDINQDSCIVVGGNHATVMPSDFDYEDSPFDFIVRGEGEVAFVDICQGKYERKKGKPTVITGTPRDMTEEIALDWSGYQYALPGRNNWLSLSRGCPYSCNFCVEQHLAACQGKNVPRWRSHPPEVAIRKIEALRKALNPVSIAFADPCFGFNQQWRCTFMSLLEEVNDLDCHIWMEIRGDLISAEDVERFSRMNIEVCFGLESGSPRVLEIMRKTNDPPKYLARYQEVLDYMSEKEVPHRIEILFNHPGETYEDYEITIRYLQSVVARQNKTSGVIMAKNYRLFPGCHVFLNLDEYRKKYGTVVTSERWWAQKWIDQERLSRSIVASSDLAQRFQGGLYWKKAIGTLNAQLDAKRSRRARRIQTLGRMSLLPYPQAVAV